MSPRDDHGQRSVLPPRSDGAGGRRGAGRIGARLLATYVPTVLLVVTIVFALPRAMPGDPLGALQDPASGVFVDDAQTRANLRAYYGLDRPLTDQYVNYLESLTRGDLGWSIARQEPVTSLIGQHLPWTLLLVGVSLTLAAGLSFVAGVAAAWRRGRRSDRTLVTALTALNAVPEYAMAVTLLILFGVVMPVLPLYGARTTFGEYGSWLAEAGDVAAHLVLPATALTLSLIGSKFLLVRNTMVSTLGQDYMVLARAKGLPERMLKYRHAGRNALLPFLTVVGIQTGFAVSGAVFVESVFAYPGMGSLILGAVETRDYPVLEASFLVLAAVVLTVNLLLESVYARVDPRVGRP